MKRIKVKITETKRTVEPYEGETIEDKCSRITENKEPITDGAPIVHTKRADGVQAQYNIRTDKWDVALTAMDRVAESKKNKIKENMKKGLTKQPKETETEVPKEPEQSKAES